jgi:hypothetical protein
MFVRLVRNMFSVVAGASVRETWQLQKVAESIVMFSVRTTDRVFCHEYGCISMLYYVCEDSSSSSDGDISLLHIRKLLGFIFSMQWESHC